MLPDRVRRSRRFPAVRELGLVAGAVCLAVTAQAQTVFSGSGSDAAGVTPRSLRSAARSGR
jgi:hypothetical protein